MQACGQVPRNRPDRPARALPFEGLRVLDMTAFWAGPMTGHLLAFLGAEVVHLESAQRPDGVRIVGGVPKDEDSPLAFVIEDAAGLTWLSSHPEEPPIEPYAIGDPNAGLHALFGLQLALEHRDRTGEGGLVEVSMLDAALNIAAEQVIEHSPTGRSCPGRATGGRWPPPRTSTG